MKNLIRSFAVVLALALTACTKVEPGYVGIVVDNYGDQKGVRDFPTRVGRIWYNPMTQDVYDYPTFMQNVVWDNEHNQSITFNSSEGAVLDVDISFSYAFIPDSVPKVFVTFRKDEQHITTVYLRSLIRSKFADIAGTMKAVDIFGSGKKQLQDSVRVALQRELAIKGILIDQVSIVGAPRVDGQVQASINAVLAASQRAIEAEAKVRQIEAEGQQNIARARADSTAVVVAAAGQAAANKLLQETTTPTVLQRLALEKWDGVLPQVQGGGTPFIQLPTIERKQ